MNLSKQIILVSVFFIFSCNQADVLQPKATQVREVLPEKPITIIIQPFNDLPKEYLDFVSAKLKKVYPNVKINPSIQKPKSAKNKAKSRYRADSLIIFLFRFPSFKLLIDFSNCCNSFFCDFTLPLS